MRSICFGDAEPFVRSLNLALPAVNAFDRSDNLNACCLPKINEVFSNCTGSNLGVERRAHAKELIRIHNLNPYALYPTWLGRLG
jgi:hypothetical protein